MVNMAHPPFMEVLPRKYRFRILSAGMSRFIQLQIADPNGNAVQFLQIANDGNLFVNPISLTSLDQQGTAERYDIVVDFSSFKIGDRLTPVNTQQQTSGRKPDGQLSLKNALAGSSNDPAVGGILQFRIVGQVQSVDVPGVILHATDSDRSVVPNVLTEQIPIVTPVRERVVQWGRSGSGDSRGSNGQCIPDCPDSASFPWSLIVNGAQVHSMNANRVSLVYPKAGDVEHWTYINEGGGWDHPIHLHFEEGITMNRGSDTIPATELIQRKDVWRLRPSGQVQFQIQFGEYGGSYVNHCHNTVHEDFALLMRIQCSAGWPDRRRPRSPRPRIRRPTAWSSRRRKCCRKQQQAQPGRRSLQSRQGAAAVGAAGAISRRLPMRCAEGYRETSFGAPFHGGTDATKAVDGHRGVRGRDCVGAGSA
jgi:FtsP/CotA-like multicopper oxidase with cupredoxin domain